MACSMTLGEKDLAAKALGVGIKFSDRRFAAKRFAKKTWSGNLLDGK